MRYVLDTNILSGLLRDPAGRITARIQSAGEQQVCTSIIVASELRFGAVKKGSKRLARHVDALLQALDVLPFESPADEVYARLRTDLERSGQPIGANDLLIAAQTLASGYTLVTDNEKEFGRVAGLLWENWLR